MRILIITRASLYDNPGGDTIQITSTAKYLLEKGITVDIRRTNETIDYTPYDLLHFFNIIRPADIMVHIRKSGKPFVVSPIFVEYAEYDRNFRKGLSGFIFGLFPETTLEYIKTVARRILNGEKIMSSEYIWLGQHKSIQKILNRASYLLPNSHSEYERLKKRFRIAAPYKVVPNGIDVNLFGKTPISDTEKDPSLVLCVARIEGIKNQLSLIKAVNRTKYKLLLIGKPANNQPHYFEACKQVAADNITFIDKIPQQELVKYYQKASVHILPSWFETTGLSSLEAAAMNCNVVITAKGDAKEYFETDAWYCDPASETSIYEAIEKAAQSPSNERLRKRVITQLTWQNAAEQTYQAYKQVLVSK